MEEYRKAMAMRQKIAQLYRWMSGWKDLDLIWEYLQSSSYYGGIEYCRERYAKARGTNIYGGPRDDA